jgi:hypothetical protein
MAQGLAGVLLLLFQNLSPFASTSRVSEKHWIVQGYRERYTPGVQKPTGELYDRT